MMASIACICLFYSIVNLYQISFKAASDDLCYSLVNQCGSISLSPGREKEKSKLTVEKLETK